MKEAKKNWVTARRAILRKPIDRIGYGGYLKLALQFPEFVTTWRSSATSSANCNENIAAPHLTVQASGRAELLG